MIMYIFWLGLFAAMIWALIDMAKKMFWFVVICCLLSLTYGTAVMAMSMDNYIAYVPAGFFPYAIYSLVVWQRVFD